MDSLIKVALWNQFGAALDTLEDALNLCPDDLWCVQLWHDEDDERYGQFWFIAFHALMWLDLFLTGSEEEFVPPAPFHRRALPEQPYSKEQVHAYLTHCRQRARSIIAALTDEQAHRICVFKWMEPSYLELQIYSLRHVQEHAAELNMILGHHGVTGMDWVAKARSSLT